MVNLFQGKTAKSLQMRNLLTILSIFTATSLFGQPLEVVEQKLNDAFIKIDYWAELRRTDYKRGFDDSLQKANDTFGDFLLKVTSSNAQTISYDFKKLVGLGLVVATSEDGYFRIYTWDTQTGGTM